MKIRITSEKPLTRGGVELSPGQVVEVPDTTAARMIEKGQAEAVSDEAPVPQAGKAGNSVLKSQLSEAVVQRNEALAQRDEALTQIGTLTTELEQVKTELETARQELAQAKAGGGAGTQTQ